MSKSGQISVFFWISLKIMKVEYHTKKKKCPEVNFTSVHQIWSKLVDKYLWKWANNSFQSAKFTNIQFVGVLLKSFTLWYQHETWQKLSSCNTDYEKCMKPVWKSKMVNKIQDGRHEIQFLSVIVESYLPIFLIIYQPISIIFGWQM